jgi:hypothetical protein
MADLVIREDDEEWLRVNYPELKIFKDDLPARIEGILRVDVAFYGQTEPFIIKPNQEHLTHGEHIQDTYRVDIIFEGSKSSDLPQVYERGGRIEGVAKTMGKNIIDLHINPNGPVCLCLNAEEDEYIPDGFNVPDFFNRLVIPFFCTQSYFEQRGLWLWGEHNHGAIGFLEWYLKKTIATKEELEKYLRYLQRGSNWEQIHPQLSSGNSIKGHLTCLCGKNPKPQFKRCHYEAFRGLWKLQQDMRRLDVSV